MATATAGTACPRCRLQYQRTRKRRNPLQQLTLKSLCKFVCVFVCVRDRVGYTLCTELAQKLPATSAYLIFNITDFAACSVFFPSRFASTTIGWSCASTH